jgi:hypothetical protein
MAAHASAQAPRSHGPIVRLKTLFGRFGDTGPVFAPHPRGTLSEAAFVAAFHAEAG